MSAMEAVPRPASLTEGAYNRLRGAILEGDLTPGEPLSVVALSHTLNMSRSPVRAAVERLAAEGLLEDMGGSFVVSDLSPQALFDAMVVREVLEGLAAELAAPRYSPAGLVELGRIHDQFADGYARNDAKAGMRADQEFHQHIQHQSGNPALVEHLDRVQSRIMVVTYAKAWTVLSQARGVAEHAAILAAIRTGDPVLARYAAIAHVHSAGERLRLEWHPAGNPLEDGPFQTQG